MRTLIIDKEKCVDCGNCEALLPGLLHKMNGQLPMSDIKYEREKHLIDLAISECHLDCILIISSVDFVYECKQCVQQFEHYGNGAPTAICPHCSQRTAKRIS